jgi:hypothetical protein
MKQVASRATSLLKIPDYIGNRRIMGNRKSVPIGGQAMGTNFLFLTFLLLPI